MSAPAVISDAEVICGFMQPRTDCTDWPFGGRSDFWWQGVNNSSRIPAGWEPRPLTLDRLWEVEERLTAEQRWAYSDVLCLKVIWPTQPSESTFSVVHATAAQKITALAIVLRGTSTCPATGAQTEKQ